MRTGFIRAMSLLLCACVFVTVLPVLEAKAISQEDYYRDMVLEHYSESFANSNYYQGLTQGDKYLYKQWAHNVEKQCAIEKGVTWVSQTLLGKNQNREAYVDYLSSLLAMVENGFSENVAAQAAYTNKLSAVDIIADATEVAFADLVPIRSEELKAACKYIGASADLLDEAISDAKVLGVVGVSATLYEQKITILQAIYENAHDPKLKEAANDLMMTSDIEIVYVLDNYADNVAGDLMSLNCDLFSTTWYKAVASALLKPETRQKVVNALASKTPEFVKTAFGSLAAASNYFSFGFTIGVNLMKIVYADRSEYYREMIAMDKISDALILELGELKQLSDSTAAVDDRYEYIKEYATIAKALVFTHLRGEYCNVESRVAEEEQQDSENYYSKIVTQLHKYEEAVGAILSNEDLYVVSDAFELHNGFIKKVVQKDQVPEGYTGIYTYEDLQIIIDNQPTRAGTFNEYVTSNYILMADIELPADYKSLSVFAGVFDGNGYRISNIQKPLFSSLANAEVKNLALDVNYVMDLEDESQDYGALARHTNGFTEDGNIITLGYNEGYNKIDNCYVTGYINLQQRSGAIGALVGNATFMEISSCYNEADIDVNSRQGCFVGGLVGENGELSNCFNTADISGFATTENTYNPWGVDVSVGGIGGYGIDAQYCYNTGNVAASAAYICRVRAGGIVGWAWIDAKIGNCYNTGTVKAEADYPAETLDKILEDEEQYLESDYAGFDAGGIVASASCWDDEINDVTWIRNCWNTGTVKSRHSAGGIAGYAGALESANCCNTGDVSGGTEVGGLFGKIEVVAVDNCYNSADVSGGAQTGSVAGVAKESCTFTNCYYLSGGPAAFASGAAVAGTKALTQQQMTQTESFEGFDFQNVWIFKEEAAENTPLLRFRPIISEETD